MKTLVTSILSMLFIICSQAHAQVNLVKEPDYNKPQLFADLPKVLDLNITDLELLIALPMGGSISSVLAENFPLKGVVVSKSGDVNADVRSVVIRLVNRPGSTFCLSKIKNETGQYKFIGRVLSMNNSDAFEIAKLDDRYVLQKKNLYDIVNE
jgi:hypothetical protein